jgi:hypothetical protein
LVGAIFPKEHMTWIIVYLIVFGILIIVYLFRDTVKDIIVRTKEQGKLKQVSLIVASIAMFIGILYIMFPFTKLGLLFILEVALEALVILGVLLLVVWSTKRKATGNPPLPKPPSGL